MSELKEKQRASYVVGFFFLPPDQSYKQKLIKRRFLSPDEGEGGAKRDLRGRSTDTVKAKKNFLLQIVHRLFQFPLGRLSEGASLLRLFFYPLKSRMEDEERKNTHTPFWALFDTQSVDRKGHPFQFFGEMRSKTTLSKRLERGKQRKKEVCIIHLYVGTSISRITFAVTLSQSVSHPPEKHWADHSSISVRAKKSDLRIRSHCALLASQKIAD